jgi:hypothetical protein
VTAPGHPREPADGWQAAQPGDHDPAASARSAGERVNAARSAECPCHAPPGAPCRPDGDHLARYLRAWQAGTLTRESLKHAIDNLDVIAPQAIVPSPAGHAPHPGQATAASPASCHHASADPDTGRTAPSRPELEPGQEREPPMHPGDDTRAAEPGQRHPPAPHGGPPADRHPSRPGNRGRLT